MLRKKKISDTRELKVIAAVIHDDSFLLNMQDIYVPGLFTDVKLDRIFEWCSSYYEEYEKAPGVHIYDIWMQAYKNEHINEEEAELIERVLKRADKHHQDGLNAEFLLDRAREFFQRKALDSLSNRIETGDVQEALKEVESFSVPDKIQTHIEPFTNTEYVKQALGKRSEPLFRFKGALGELLNPHLTRDSFIAFLAPEKRGKTWWLFECALQAHKCRKNVALIQCGDLSQDQGLKRLYHRLGGKPIREYQLGRCLQPVIDCKKNQDGSCAAIHKKNEIVLLNEEDEKPEWEDAPDGYEVCEYCLRKGRDFPKDTWFKEIILDEVLTEADCDRIAVSFRNRTKGKEFRLSTFPNSTLSVIDLDNILKRWKRAGFCPDVLVVDYADIMLSNTSYKEMRHQENEKWKHLRKISQKYECCLITATQADAASYSDNDITLSNFSEDKRKFAHATAFLALNQTQKDKAEKVMRVSMLILREGEFDPHKQVKVLQNLVVGNPHLDSFWVYSF